MQPATVQPATCILEPMTLDLMSERSTSTEKQIWLQPTSMRIPGRPPRARFVEHPSCHCWQDREQQSPLGIQELSELCRESNEVSQLTVVCREARISPHDGEPDQIVVSVETTIADL
jgi:hypothetical protein